MSRTPVPRPLRWLVSVMFLGGVVLDLSGRWTDPILLTYVGVWAGVGLLGTVLVPDETVRARLRGGPAGSDRLGLVAFRVLGPAHLGIGALDAGRFHWSAPIAPPLRLAAIAGLTLALGVMVWAVAVNRFFMPAVRLQPERGHHIVTTGPYLALAIAAFVLRRVMIEDRLVRAELPGYGQYADRVRYRLVPGVW